MRRKRSSASYSNLRSSGVAPLIDTTLQLIPETGVSADYFSSFSTLIMMMANPDLSPGISKKLASLVSYEDYLRKNNSFDDSHTSRTENQRHALTLSAEFISCVKGGFLTTPNLKRYLIDLAFLVYGDTRCYRDTVSILSEVSDFILI